ncbi:hypothetical protein D3C81_2137330 [compost metagenome]
MTWTALLQGQPFGYLNQQLLDQTSALSSGQQSNGLLPRKALLRFIKPALRFLGVPKQRLGHGCHMQQPEQTITLAQA